MSDELPIGPNPCSKCGGEYGQHAEDCSSLAATPGSAAIFEYDGEIYVRPIGRGICLTEKPDWEHLEDKIPEGYYMAKIVVTRQPSPPND